MSDRVPPEPREIQEEEKLVRGQLGLVCLLLLSFTAAMSVALLLKAAPALPPDQTPLLSQMFAESVSGAQAPTLIPNLASTGSRARGLSRILRLPGQPGVDGNTVALYHFDAPNGSTAIDATGSYTATLHGNAAVTLDGLYAGALQLDGRDGPGSYLRTGNLGSLSSGTIEAFVDFQTACANTSDYFGIFSIGGEFGANQSAFWLGTDGFLKFKVFVDNKLYVADSSVNPCRYLDGNGNKDPYFSYLGLPALWPYETWRFHHVAGTWGPRGIEIWVDGVLHGVGIYIPDPNNPPSHDGYVCSPQQQETSVHYPNCDSPAPGLVLGSYAGGLPAYSTFLIGCDSNSSCFKGRIDEVRISNVQRTFTTAVDPPSTPLPTQTPVPITGEYMVDSNTLALYHLSSMEPKPWRTIIDETYPTTRNSVWEGNPVLVPGRFGNALFLDGDRTYFQTGDAGNPPNGTIEAWINLAGVNGPFGIVNVGTQMDDGTGRLLLGMPPNSNTLRLGMDSDGWYWADSGIDPRTLLGCWHHIAGVWGTGGLEIWVDGQLRGTGAYYGRIPVRSDPYIFGCDSMGRCMRGKIDEARLSAVRRTFSTRALAGRASTPAGVHQAVADGTRYYLPLIQVAPTASVTATPVCLFGY